MEFSNVYTEKELKLMHDAGFLVRCSMNQGDSFWYLSFEIKSDCDGEEVIALIRSQRQEQRRFKTSDAALKVAALIGFQNVDVNLRRLT